MLSYVLSERTFFVNEIIGNVDRINVIFCDCKWLASAWNSWSFEEYKSQHMIGRLCKTIADRIFGKTFLLMIDVMHCSMHMEFFSESPLNNQ